MRTYNILDRAIEAFRAAIGAVGLTPPDTIHDDGLIHRFSTNGRRGDDSGWYVYHGDDIPEGAFGCWRSGLQSTWCAKSDSTMTAAEREAHRQCIKAMKAQRDAEQAQRHESAATTAAALWQQADPATVHPYLTAKGVQPHGIKTFGDKLLIPMRDTAGTLHSLQTIAPDGDIGVRGRQLAAMEGNSAYDLYETTQGQLWHRIEHPIVGDGESSEEQVSPSFNRTCFGVAAPGIISFSPGFATLAHAG